MRLYAIQDVLTIGHKLVVTVLDTLMYKACIIEHEKECYVATGKTIHEAMCNLETNVILGKNLST